MNEIEKVREIMRDMTAFDIEIVIQIAIKLYGRAHTMEYIQAKHMSNSIDGK